MEQPIVPPTEVQPIKLPSKKFPIATIIIILISILVTGGAVYAWQKSANEQTVYNLEQRIANLEKEASTATQPSSQTTSSNQEESTASTQDDWKLYDGAKYGVTFSYPANFQIVTDKIQAEYKGHPQGFNWYRIELTDPAATEKPVLRFEIDPDGYGPFFPDKTYQITESSDRKVVVNSTENSSSENSKDGETLIIPNVLEAGNGHAYSWQFYFNEGGKDYEPEFKQILSTFQFSK